MAHDVDLCLRFLQSVFVESKCVSIVPSRAWLHVVREWHPQPVKAVQLCSERPTCAQVNYVCKAHPVQCPHVLPTLKRCCQMQAAWLRKYLHACLLCALPNLFKKHMVYKHRFWPGWACKTNHLPCPAQWGFTNALCWQRRPWLR